MEIKDLKQHIKELMSAMGRTGMKRVVIKHDNFELELERSESQNENESAHVSLNTLEKSPYLEGIGKPLPSSMNPLPHEHGGHQTIQHQDKTPSASHEGSHFITSPMVGTFYLSSSPEAQAFVKTGDTVNKDDVVCIIEAMKVMNEIKAGISGTIIEVLASNGDPVEFGSKLFRVR